MSGPGWVIVLNGAPRSGKSSIAGAIQASFDGLWMNLGVDLFQRATPARYWPGMGLRPGGGRPDIEVLLPALYGAFYDSVAAHSRHGLNVVVDVGHHDAYSTRLALLEDGARRLAGLPVLLVGVRCPVDEVLRRRQSSALEGGRYETADVGQPVPEPVLRWQHEVHVPGIYDLEVDTRAMTPAQCAHAIRARLHGPPPSAMETLRAAAGAARRQGRGQGLTGA